MTGNGQNFGFTQAINENDIFYFWFSIFFIFMKLIRFLFLFIVSLSSTICVASTVDYNAIFTGKDGCFILYDLTTNKQVVKYNEKHCAERFSPASSFKIAIAIMVFDQKILKDENSIIKWDGVNRSLVTWNQDQTAKTWLEYSTVWVSQKFTSQIGTSRIKKYLADFNYGNQDISGGITQFWLSSTLTISANEQLEFLKLFWSDKLPVTREAMELTKRSLHTEKSEDGNVITGKTGSAVLDGKNNPNSRRVGWFVGQLSHAAGHDYIFVTNFNDIEKPDMQKFAGEEAELITKQILHAMRLY
jgi:beta-lactamase class D